MQFLNFNFKQNLGTKSDSKTKSGKEDYLSDNYNLIFSLLSNYKFKKVDISSCNINFDSHSLAVTVIVFFLHSGESPIRDHINISLPGVG